MEKTPRKLFAFHQTEITAILIVFIGLSSIMFTMGVIVGNSLANEQSSPPAATAAMNETPLEPAPPVTAEPILADNTEAEAAVEKTISRTPPTEVTQKSLASQTEASGFIRGETSGPYSVQVGSYPSNREASDRIERLKQLGYPYAFITSAELKEVDKKNATWFRVWLGYFNDSMSAHEAGKHLQDKGEVKNYLVRKTDNHNQKN